MALIMFYHDHKNGRLLFYKANMRACVCLLTHVGLQNDAFYLATYAVKKSLCRVIPYLVK